MIAENIERIKKELPEGVSLVAVSKVKPDEDIMEAYAAGQRAFGENYATELRDKHLRLPKDIEWHFIGHVQSKQIKYYIDYVSLIHGVDSEEHLREIDLAAKKAGRTVGVLLQFHIAQESTKFGFVPEEMGEISRELIEEVRNVNVRGVMGMATQTADEGEVRSEFRRLRKVYEELKTSVFEGKEDFDVVSMGMSHDYHIAIEEGSNMVRVGSLIFGERDYSLRKR